MGNKVDVSVIIPVYNVEKYLKRCLDSITNQSFNNIEIICINDGSTDNSLSILEQYKNNDSRITILNKENGGISSARNFGLDNVNGEYILFVDSDDWIHRDMIGELFSISKDKNLDVSMCSYSREYSNKSRIKKFNIKELTYYNESQVKNNLHRKIIGPIEEELANPEHTDSLVTAWGKLYKTSIINDNRIRFIDMSIIGSEDCLFNVYAFKYIKSAAFLNKPYYYYWKENSNSLTSVYKKDLYKKWFTMYDYIYKFIKENNYNEDFYKALNNRICMSVLGLGLNECNRGNKIIDKKKIKKLKEILNEEILVDAYKNFELKSLPIHWRIFYIFNKKKLVIPTYFMLNIIEFLRNRI